MTAAGAADQNSAGALIELPAAMNGRWIQVDLDEVLEAVEFCGLPQRELIATYLDRRSRRRMFVRVCAHGRKEVAA
jgi:hypothetical protein